VTAPTSAEKRERATTITTATPILPVMGNLDVRWDSQFDRLCYDLATPALGRKDPARYASLLADLTTGTGCTEEELVTHGQKVRSVLFFAEDRLARQGLLSRLRDDQQHEYHLPPVTRSF
jgi:hypothetical protein